MYQQSELFYFIIIIIFGIKLVGAVVAGGRGFYLKGDGVRLNQALIHFGLDFLEKREFMLLQTPFFYGTENNGKLRPVWAV